MNMNKYLNKDDIQYNNFDNDKREKKYETYYYCGQHVDGCDRYGPIRVYHYISKSKLNGRNVDTLNFWEGELEFWPSDAYWLEASRKKEFIVEEDNDKFLDGFYKK